jgi:hypothetical protein
MSGDRELTLGLALFLARVKRAVDDALASADETWNPNARETRGEMAY